jgi:putative hydrolase of the HAD superfamily
MEYPYLLLDAGGTLVFPDQEFMAHAVAAEGSIVDPDRIYEAHFRLVHQYDMRERDTSRPVSVSLCDFFMDLLTNAGASKGAAERTLDRLLTRHEETSLWTYTKPWVVETLATLKSAGIRMSVISNARGRVRQQLDACGITPYLEAVFDSAIVGIEKPDPRLFLHALKELGLTPPEAVYIGDHRCVDVVGANRAGIGAVHLDPLRCYADWPGLHLRDIRALPDWIAEVRSNPERFDLFPACARR